MKHTRKIIAGPSNARKALNFAGAGTRHMLAGFPQATDEQVSERFTICQGCELYEAKDETEGKCLHPSCGCSLKRVGVTGRNKLRWADEECPLKKWLGIEASKIEREGETEQ